MIKHPVAGEDDHEVMVPADVNGGDSFIVLVPWEATAEEKTPSSGGRRFILSL